jgi:uncharacterized protein (TIGR00297 family)
MIYEYIILLVILLAGMIFSIATKRLNTSAAITGAVIGFCVFLGAGFTGLIMMTTFFVLGSFATSWKFDTKLAQGLAENNKNKGTRTSSQVIANAGVAAILGLLAWLLPAYSYLFIFMMSAAFASATADTLSSELGNVYGSRYYNIRTLKTDARGENGVISIEGTVFGIAGSFVIAFIFCLTYGWSGLLPVVIAGTIGNIADSFLGATLERKQVLTNDVVNFLNTFIAALVAWLIYSSVDFYLAYTLEPAPIIPIGPLSKYSVSFLIM